VQIYFRNTKLKKTCESERELLRKYGPELGPRIAQRLSELRALRSLDDATKIPHLGLHQLKAGRDEQFGVDLPLGRRIVLEIAHNPIPRKDDGGVALSEVTEVVVVEIVDYH
jgi:plasmid maintenance system killer protein